MTDTTEAVVVGPDLDGITDRFQLWEYGRQYGMVRELDEHRYVAVVPFMFTWGLISGRKADVLIGHSLRWCFKRFDAALLAGMAWDGAGDPPGPWIKDQITGRRRDENGKEYVDL